MYKVKERREQLNISQEKLAEISGVSRTVLSSLETDDKTVTTTSTLLKLAKALNCSVQDIFLN